MGVTGAFGPAASLGATGMIGSIGAVISGGTMIVAVRGRLASANKASS
jgi:hypothetical protein